MRTYKPPELMLMAVKGPKLTQWNQNVNDLATVSMKGFRISAM